MRSGTWIPDLSRSSVVIQVVEGDLFSLLLS